MTKRNTGCRKARDVWGIVLGLLFAALGLYSLAGGSLLGGGLFLFLGLLFIITFARDVKKLSPAAKTIKWTPKNP